MSQSNIERDRLRHQHENMSPHSIEQHIYRNRIAGLTVESNIRQHDTRIIDICIPHYYSVHTLQHHLQPYLPTLRYSVNDIPYYYSVHILSETS